MDAQPHLLTLQDRARLTVTGVTAVSSFDDRTVLLCTVQGELTVIGRELRVEQLSTGNGALSVEGDVQAVRYGDRSRTAPQGFFGRLLR